MMPKTSIRLNKKIMGKKMGCNRRFPPGATLISQIHDR
jgi:hypothetical protein